MNFIANLIKLYYSNKIGQVSVLITMGWFFVPIINFINKYIWSDWEFVMWLSVLLIIDTATGIWKSVKFRTFSANDLGKVFNKIAAYILALISIHACSAYLISRGQIHSYSYFIDIARHFDAMLYASIMFRELWSINENINAIGLKILPNYILKYMKNFDENGNYMMSAALEKPLEETEKPQNEENKKESDNNDFNADIKNSGASSNGSYNNSNSNSVGNKNTNTDNTRANKSTKKKESKKEASDNK